MHIAREVRMATARETFATLTDEQRKRALAAWCNASALREYWALTETLERAGIAPREAERMAFDEVWHRLYPESANPLASD